MPPIYIYNLRVGSIAGQCMNNNHLAGRVHYHEPGLSSVLKEHGVDPVTKLTMGYTLPTLSNGFRQTWRCKKNYRQLRITVYDSPAYITGFNSKWPPSQLYM